MDLRKCISPKRGFQSSVNIAYDLHRDDKIEDFIPTQASLEVLEEFLLGTAVSATERARILIGAYGKGKSHLILVLLAILQKKDAEVLKRILEALKVYKPALYHYVLDEILADDKKPFLPIIIDGSNSSIVQSFLWALHDTLDRANLADLMPSTHYQAALRRIESWKRDYKETYIAFTNMLHEPVREFVSKLSNYDTESYAVFEKLYPKLTAGSEFNPFLGVNIVDLYGRVNDIVCEKGYRGIYVVYDEFSKYMEANISSASVSDTRMLQDFAEKCARSGQKQMHLLLIAHKDIANYIDELPKDKVDGWKGVSERFKHMEVRNNFTQLYEIIGRVIEKKPRLFKTLQNENKCNFANLALSVKQYHIFDDLDEEDRQLVISATYPLHPVTTFLLPRLSERIAQNERTLFTFLARDSKYTLVDFLRTQQESFPVLTPDYLYDYFEPLFRQEPYTSEIKHIYAVSNKIINQLGTAPLEIKLVKTIALIYMINQFEKLPPVVEILHHIYMFDVVGKDLSDAIDNLVEKKFVIYQNLSNGYLRLKESSGIDIRQKCLDMAEKNKSIFGVKQILSGLTENIYFYPTQYNDENEIVRYFTFRFISSSDFRTTHHWNRKINDDYLDGVVFAIIPDSQADIEELEELLLERDNDAERCLFILPHKWSNIKNIAYEYKAISVLQQEVEDDPVLAEEYDIYFADVEAVMMDFVQSYIKPEMRRASYYHQGCRQKIYRKAQLGECLSAICQQVYPFTPVINNEALNRNMLTAVAIHTRARIIQGLLAEKLEPMLGQKGNSQGISFIRSSLTRLQILQNAENMPRLVLHGLQDKNVQHVIDLIEQFILNADGGENANFGVLYQQLRSVQYHIGLKKGVIPIFLAVVLHSHRQHLVIRHKEDELEITADLLNAIEVKPEEYNAYLEEWSQEKTAYIQGLETLFAEYVLHSEKEYSNFGFLVKAMQRWFIALPSYTKNTKVKHEALGHDVQVNEQCLAIMKSLKRPSINGREYIFDKLPALLNLGNLRDVVNELMMLKQIIDCYKVDLLSALQNDLIHIFGENVQENTSLYSAIHDWLDTLSASTLDHVFSDDKAVIMELLKTASNDVEALIERLAKAATGLRIDDWDDRQVNVFLEEIREFKETVELYAAESKNTVQSLEFAQATMGDDYHISYVDALGKHQIKTFNKITYNNRGKLLRNEIEDILDGMGEALSIDEKRQVLMEILEKMF